MVIHVFVSHTVVVYAFKCTYCHLVCLLFEFYLIIFLKETFFMLNSAEHEKLSMKFKLLIHIKKKKNQ